MSEETCSSTLCIQSQTCSFDTREGANSYITCSYNFCIGTEFRSFCLKSFHVCCLILVRFFLPRRQSWLSNLVLERTIVLFVSDHRTSLLVPVCHDWNYMSLFSNIVPVPSTENSLPLSSQRSVPLSTTSFWTLEFRVRINWSIWLFTDVVNGK